MKKFYLIAAAAAAVLAAGCAKNEVIQNQGPGDAVSFGVYAPKTVTKAGVSATDFGSITTATLQAAASAGFGVFGYYTGNDNYAPASHAANFMYNEQVTYTDTDGDSTPDSWTYSPVKYWPNEHGASAISTDTDKLTFLCYAPYVANLVINGNTNSTVSDGAGTPAAATEGIKEMTGNTAKESASLTFSVPQSSEEQIDLLYGVINNPRPVNVDGNPEGTLYNPIENLTKEKTNGHVNILFKHALAKATIDILDVVDDVPAPTSVNPASDGTIVVVKSLNILGGTGAKVFGTSGVLNLYTGAWSGVSGTSSFSVAPLPACISVASTPNSQPNIEGVLEGGLTDANYTSVPGKIEIMFIPGGDITGIEIVYYVCTADNKLGFNGGASIIENHITKYFDTDTSIAGDQPIETAMGFQYNITIRLGLTSVKLNADVELWGTDDNPIDLPQNVS